MGNYADTLSRLQAWFVDAGEAVRRGNVTNREVLRDASATYDASGFRPIIGDSRDGHPLYGILCQDPGKKPHIQLSTSLDKMVGIAKQAMCAAGGGVPCQQQ